MKSLSIFFIVIFFIGSITSKEAMQLGNESSKNIIFNCIRKRHCRRII